MITLISLGISTFGGIALAWIAYKQARLSKTMETLEKQTNSIKDALVASTAQASHAEGILAGKAEARVEQKQDALPPTA